MDKERDIILYRLIKEGLIVKVTFMVKPELNEGVSRGQLGEEGIAHETGGKWQQPTLLQQSELEGEQQEIQGLRKDSTFALSALKAIGGLWVKE